MEHPMFKPRTTSRPSRVRKNLTTARPWRCRRCDTWNDATDSRCITCSS
jgi:hypothetical protein